MKCLCAKGLYQVKFLALFPDDLNYLFIWFLDSQEVFCRIIIKISFVVYMTN